MRVYRYMSNPIFCFLFCFFSFFFPYYNTTQRWDGAVRFAFVDRDDVLAEYIE